jgi:hypothetical protein
MSAACSRCSRSNVRRLYVRLYDGSFWCGRCYLQLWALRLLLLAALFLAVWAMKP